jgi:predicted KAP-like P-loop ATPase
MKFLIDKEVNLNTDDLLKTSSYSKALYEVINSAPTDAAFTIGLFGEWGSGKSSIVKTVGEEFSTTKKIKFVVYDAWKYSNDSFRRMFLLKLQQDLGFERTEKFDSFYRNKTSDVSVKRKVDWKYIILTAII